MNPVLFKPMAKNIMQRVGEGASCKRLDKTHLSDIVSLGLIIVDRM